MPEIAPFRALRYDPAAVPELQAVVAPPYDVISPDARRAYAAHPYNIVRLTLPQDNDADVGGPAADRYARAGRTFAAWRSGGVLRRDREAALYPYAQEFTLGERRLRRLGLLAAVRLAAYDERRVLPHERTFARYRDDRLRLMRACPANLEAILGFYGGADAAIQALAAATRSPALAECVDREGVQHRLWRVTGAAAASLSALLREPPLAIADGHHRYETALTYRDERLGDLPAAAARERPEAFVLAHLVHADDPGLVVLPTHRIVRAPVPPAFATALARDFDLRDLGRGLDALRAALAALQAERGAEARFLAGWPDGRVTSLRLRDARIPETLVAAGHSPALARLDVAILHAVVIERLLGIAPGDPDALAYERDERRAWERVVAGGAGLGLFLSAPRPAEVMALALAGDRMPQKSTFFYPKVLSGLVIRPMDEEG